jgi:hypothetical protein
MNFLAWGRSLYGGTADEASYAASCIIPRGVLLPTRARGQFPAQADRIATHDAALLRIQIHGVGHRIGTHLD